MIKTVLWDFDGVILDSMEVRDWGFEEIFKDFNKDLTMQLLAYHRNNGGLSRYVKIRYFFEEILNQPITEEEVLEYARKFSLLMRVKLTNPKNLVLDAVDYIKKNHQNYNFHIVSGSDQEELRFLNRELGMDKYFISIHGSPTPKKQLVVNLLGKHNYQIENTCLIGDSINDYEAARYNNIAFYGYNNFELSPLGNYVESLKNHKFY